MKRIYIPPKIPIFLLLFAFLFNSCEKKEQVTKFRVNQFKQTAVTSGPVMTLSVQQDSEIGGTNWKPLHQQIVGFDYEPGYIYELLVVETKILNPPANGSANAYRLQQVLSKTKVATAFNLDLKIASNNFVQGDAASGYDLLTETKIDCGNLCSQFDQAIHSSSQSIVGKFMLNTDGSIRLVGLTVN